MNSENENFEMKNEINRENKHSVPENKMGTMPVNKLLISMSLPVIISMLVQALYNIVDSVFVSRISEDALTAVSLAFPIQNLMIAIAAGTGVGINALLSRSLGEKNFKEANYATCNGLLLGFLSAVVFVVFGLFFSGVYFRSQFSAADMAENAEQCERIISYGIDYMTIISVFSFGLFLQITNERLLQSTGKSIYSMYTQGLGAIINIILDPIMIFGYFGLPRMEVKGAAIATVTGQLIAMSLAFLFNLTKNKELSFKPKYFRPRFRTIGTIYSVGLPSIIMQSIGSVMTYGMNQILLLFSPTAVSVFGVYFKLQSFIFMPVFGLNNGMIPIIAYNYGARKRSRIISTAKLSITIAVSIMLVGFAVFQIIPGPLLSIFDATEEMLAIGIPALRIISLSFLFAGYCIIVGSIFQALGNGIYSLIISVARQLVVILPIAYLFAKLLGLTAVWFSFPLAELVSVTLSTLFLIRIFREKLSNMEG